MLSMLNAYRHLILEQSNALESAPKFWLAQRLSASDLGTALTDCPAWSDPTLLNAYRHLILEQSRARVETPIGCAIAQRLSASDLGTERSLDLLIHMKSQSILQASVESMQWSCLMGWVRLRWLGWESLIFGIFWAFASISKQPKNVEFLTQPKFEAFNPLWLTQQAEILVKNPISNQVIQADWITVHANSDACQTWDSWST